MKKRKKVRENLVLSGMLVIIMVLSTSISVFAKENQTEKRENVRITLNNDCVQTQMQTGENEMMWIENATMYKMEVLETYTDNDIGQMCTSTYIQVSEKELSDIEKQSPDETIVRQKIHEVLESNLTDRVTPFSLSKSDQAWDSSYTIKATLKVKYDYFGNSLKIYSASGSFTRAAYNGVVINSGKLRYSATGQIYKNGQFQRNGTVSNTITSDSGVFTNTTLMGNNTEVRNPTIAGVVYSIYASRGVSVEVPVSLA
ncbi:MAG: hypothetical protein ACLUP2_01465 [Lachnospiraceae bacterium]